MDEDMDFDSGAPSQSFPPQDSQFNNQVVHGDPNRKMLYVALLFLLSGSFNIRCSDLVFVQDCTGSQGSYISSATKNIENICGHIFESGKLQVREDLRIGLVAFRDHPPQDHTYIVKNFGFSSDISKVQKDLSSLYASGGGDGPEAVTAALVEALNMDWRENASKMVVLIADAPPHGIGEYGDGEYRQLPSFFEPLTFVQVLTKDRLMAMILCKSLV